MTKDTPKVGFVFSTKDRVDFTLRSLASVDSDSGFDLIWVDGSDTPEGKALPQSAKLSNIRLVEVHYNIKGGPDHAIRFGLRRLLDLGYDYCGLIENDIEFKPGWCSRLMELFELGRTHGLRVGAATVRTIASRVMMYQPQYALMWNMGAGMVLFTREAAKIVLSTYPPSNTEKIARVTFSPPSAKRLSKFYMDQFGVDLRNVWELWMQKSDRELGCDWAYAMQLYKYGFYSLGSIPLMAINIDFDLEATFHTSYVSQPVSVSETGNIRFSQLLKAVDQGGMVSWLKRTIRLIGESIKSSIFWWAKRQNKHVVHMLHPVRFTKLLYRRVRVYI